MRLGTKMRIFSALCVLHGRTHIHTHTLWLHVPCDLAIIVVLRARPRRNYGHICSDADERCQRQIHRASSPVAVRATATVGFCCVQLLLVGFLLDTRANEFASGCNHDIGDFFSRPNAPNKYAHSYWHSLNLSQFFFIDSIHTRVR